jgi:hypothetical protein
MTTDVDARRVVLVLLLGGCGAAPLSADAGSLTTTPDGGLAPTEATVVTVQDESRLTSLHFTTSSAFPTNPKPKDVDVTLTTPAPVRAIFEATLALPVFPPGVYNCAVDVGYSHTITFMAGAAVLATATLEEGGCSEAEISGAPPTRQTSDAYWTLVAQNLGIDESDLFAPSP